MNRGSAHPSPGDIIRSHGDTAVPFAPDIRRLLLVVDLLASTVCSSRLQSCMLTASVDRAYVFGPGYAAARLP